MRYGYIEEDKEYVFRLKDKINSGGDFVSLTENLFEGRDAIVVSAGPSAKGWKSLFELEIENKPVIICVKQAKNLVGDICSVHFLNSANLVKYENLDSALTIMTRNSQFSPVFGSYDINFSILEDHIGDSRFYLGCHGFYESFEIPRTGAYRPVGPGIMHESVFFMLAHMGFKRISTIGWDIAGSDGVNSHFYDKGISGETIEKRKTHVALMKNKAKRFFGRRFIFFIKKIFYFPAFYLGFKVNKALMFDGEANLVSESLPGLHKWLNSKSIELIIHGNSKWVKDQSSENRK